VSSRPAPEAAQLRPAGPEDADFLLRVYASTREEELAVVAWTDDQRATFLRAQFTAQDTYWRQQRPDAAREVVEVGGRPAGRLYVDRTPDEIRIVDIALLSEFREAGVGTALLREVLEEGEATGLPVTIHVERGNRARGLYARLGFRRIGGTGVYDLLERRAGDDASGARQNGNEHVDG
jgi:ribosomal protein S18 acetylase RimI-like enzyme